MPAAGRVLGLLPLRHARREASGADEPVDDGLGEALGNRVARIDVNAGPGVPEARYNPHGLKRPSPRMTKPVAVSGEAESVIVAETCVYGVPLRSPSSVA